MSIRYAVIVRSSVRSGDFVQPKLRVVYFSRATQDSQRVSRVGARQYNDAANGLPSIPVATPSAAVEAVQSDSFSP